MTVSNVNEFINTFEEIGDIWTFEQVMDVYGTWSLAEAIADRKASIDKMGTIISAVLNR